MARPRTPSRAAPALPGVLHAGAPGQEAYRAFLARDDRYEGAFVAGARTTATFCRPACDAPKAARDDLAFFPAAWHALVHGYRPCARCRPMAPRGGAPAAMSALLSEVEAAPRPRLREADLPARGLAPEQVRRWFVSHHGMTFHAYQRALRLARVTFALGQGEERARAAYRRSHGCDGGFQEAMQSVIRRQPPDRPDVPVVHLTLAVTPLGPMMLGATGRGACLLQFTDRPMLETQLARLARRLNCAFVPEPNDMARRLQRELDAYFAGTLRVFRTPVLTPGTAFQQRVWRSLRRIPHGRTATYAEQAQRLGAPAARAVARANGDNRLAIVIPCHRLVGSDGSLTGYGGGLWRKRVLLEHERAGRPASRRP